MTPPSQTGPSTPWDLVAGLVLWSAWPFALGGNTWSFIPLGISLIFVPVGCALGAAHRERNELSRSEREYARLAGAIVAVPFGFVLGAMLAMASGGDVASLWVVLGLSVAFGAVVGPRAAVGLSDSAWWLLPSTPIATASLVYLATCLAMAHVGHWPEPGRPDPESLHGQIPLFTTIDVLATMGTLVSPLLPCTLLLVVPLWFRTGERRRYALRGSRFFALAFVGWITLMILDPGGAVEWLLD